jgi:hypothetical protein
MKRIVIEVRGGHVYNVFAEDEIAAVFVVYYQGSDRTGTDVTLLGEEVSIEERLSRQAPVFIDAVEAALD